MGRVVSHMTMSLDGFIADPHDGVAELFGWYEAGTVTVPSAGERWSFTVDERSAQLLREVLAATGALVCGRRLFDHTSGWDDRHPVGAPVVVVTPLPAPGCWQVDDHHLRRQRGERDCRRQADRRGQGRRHRQRQYRRPGPGSGLGRGGDHQPCPGAAGDGNPYFANLARAPHGSMIRSSSPAAASPTCAMPYGVPETGPALPQREHH
jgi:hypothetical protein